MRKSYRDREPVTIESNSVDTTTTDGEAEKHGRDGRRGRRTGRGGQRMVDGECEGRPMTRRKYLAADGELSRGERQSRVPPAGN